MNSYVPAHVLEQLLRQPHKPDPERLGFNWAMHWGQGILMGAVRGLMAAKGFRGPVGSFMFMNVHLLNDQTLENTTGAGAPPWTWPKDEQVIDLLHGIAVERRSVMGDDDSWNEAGNSFDKYFFDLSRYAQKAL